MIISDFILRPLNLKKDLHKLYEFHICNDLYLYSVKIPLNSIEVFGEWLTNNLKNDFFDFCVIEYKNEIIGFAYDYNFSMKDGHTKIAVYIENDRRSCGLGGFAAISFIKYLFDKYPLRKVYLTIYDYNKESYISNTKAGFVHEGTLKEYKYYNGKYYDLHYLSMDRITFYNKLARMIL